MQKGLLKKILMTGAVSAFAVMSAPGALLITQAAETPTTTVINVHPADLDNTSSNPAVVATDGLNKWFMYNDSNDTIDNTLGTFVTGPTSTFYGTGSIQFMLGANPMDRKNIATYQFSGMRLASITQMSFGVYSHSGVASANEDPYLNFNVDFTGASSSYQRRLVYVPSVNASVTQDMWQQFDAVSGGNAMWSYSGPTWPATAVGPDANATTTTAGTTARSLSTILADYPGIRVLPVGGWLGIRVGEPGPTNYTANVDFFSIGTASGTTVYNFDPAAPAPVVTITTASLPTGTAGMAYDQFVHATSTNASDTLLWNITGLPTGLGYSTSTGEITGTPAASGTSPLGVTVTGANPSSTPATTTLNLVIGAPAATSSVVTIVKYLNGAPATASTTGGASFPMTATWNASNTGAGTGNFSLGPVGFNNPNPYQATTAAMTNGASYSVTENASTTCGANSTQLVGYTTGTTLDGAASSTATTTTPNFTNLTTNEYVIVWNHTCTPTSTTPTSTFMVHVLKYLDGVKATASTTHGYQFPMTATWTAANLNGGSTTSGSYVLGNNFGNASDTYGANTAAMQSPASYMTSEVTGSDANVLAMGAACMQGKYRLDGYTTSSMTFADAAAKSLSTGTPNFVNASSDQYVIVWNETCGNSTTTPSSTPQMQKQGILDGLKAFRKTLADPSDRQWVQTAIFYVRQSLNKNLWTDASHVISKNGRNVFDDEAGAVANLKQLLAHKKGVVNDATVQGYINGLVADDRLLATTAIADATAANGTASLIAKANVQLGKGDTAMTNGTPATAIEFYENAWNYAVQSH